jgi:hypothetical protein
MPEENQDRTRRSLLRIGVGVVVAAVGFSQIASAAKEKALEKKGYVDVDEDSVKKTTKKAAKKKAAKKKATRKKKAAKRRKKKAAKRKAGQ